MFCIKGLNIRRTFQCEIPFNVILLSRVFSSYSPAVILISQGSQQVPGAVGLVAMGRNLFSWLSQLSQLEQEEEQPARMEESTLQDMMLIHT